jgi:hypothetical protein
MQFRSHVHLPAALMTDKGPPVPVEYGTVWVLGSV